MKVSYSSVDRFKNCPQKYYLSKDYEQMMQAAAFAFGAALEDSVTALLQGEPFEKAYGVFKKHWKVRPANRFSDDTPIFDSESIFYYASSYDAKLLSKYDLKLLKTWYEELMEEKAPPLVVDYIDALKDVIKAGDNLDPKDRQFYHRALWLMDRNRAGHMLKAFQENIMPEIEEVISCQDEISVSNSEGDELVGFIDYVVKMKNVEGPVIVDLKTAGKLYEDHDIDAGDQLRSYAAAKDINKIAYWVLLKRIKHNVYCNKCNNKRSNWRKRNCEACFDGKYTINQPEGLTQVLVKTLDEQDLKDTMQDFSEVLTAIKNEVKWKNPRNCFAYNTKCEFYDHCHNRKPLEEMTNLKKRDK